MEQLAVLKHTSLSRLFREKSDGLARGEPLSPSSSQLWRWNALRVAKASTAAAAAVLPKGHRE